MSTGFFAYLILNKDLGLRFPFEVPLIFAAYSSYFFLSPDLTEYCKLDIVSGSQTCFSPPNLNAYSPPTFNLNNFFSEFRNFRSFAY